jgi:hypothetical protein
VLAERTIFEYLAPMRGFLAMLLVGLGALVGQGRMAEPRFAEGGQLVRPEGYRQWIFVGSSIGMSYKEGEAGGAPEFHNIYLQPQAYRQFAETGKFPDKTILVMEVLSAGGNASINKRGHFEDRFIGIEAAVKDAERFPEKWAYFDFIGNNGQALPRAKAFPKEACWKCHNEHGAADNVFVQFYPILRAAAEARAPVHRP